MAIALEWQGVSHGFQNTRALDRVSLQVDSGTICGIMGPNGAGKTTLLKIAAGLMPPTLGRVRRAGQALYPHSRHRQAEVGVLLGDIPGCYAPLSLWENLRFFAALQGLSGPQAEASIAALLEQLQIEEPHKPFQMCASGIKQRVLLARALLHDPPLLLLDEPTRHLDAARAETVRALLVQLQRRGKTIVFTTHQAAEAEALAQQRVLLERGRIRSLDSVLPRSGLRPAGEEKGTTGSARGAP